MSRVISTDAAQYFSNRILTIEPFAHDHDHHSIGDVTMDRFAFGRKTTTVAAGVCGLGTDGAKGVETIHLIPLNHKTIRAPIAGEVEVHPPLDRQQGGRVFVLVDVVRDRAISGEHVPQMEERAQRLAH